jgi:hypothetical protein
VWFSGREIVGLAATTHADQAGRRQQREPARPVRFLTISESEDRPVLALYL